MKQCAWCQKTFEPSISSQIYCGEFCRTEATKVNQARRIRDNKVKARKNKKRLCANKDCKQPLSIYNDSKYCASCFFSEHIVLKEIKAIKMLADEKNDGS